MPISLLLKVVCQQDPGSGKIMDSWQSDTTGRSSKYTTGRVTKPALHFNEIQLGVLIRATPSGRFFRGTWHQQPVTVKARLTQAACSLVHSPPVCLTDARG